MIALAFAMLFSTDRTAICDLLKANGSNSNCTTDVGIVGQYLRVFNCLDISDQVNNPTGSFNTSQLRHQARQLPYVMTDLLNRDDVMLLYSVVLPRYSVPDISFLNAVDITPTANSTTKRPGGNGISLYVTRSVKINHVVT